jgi:hypothetical protein
MTKAPFTTAAAVVALTMLVPDAPARAQDSDQIESAEGAAPQRAERQSREPRQGGIWNRAEDRYGGDGRAAAETGAPRRDWGDAARARPDRSRYRNLPAAAPPQEVVRRGGNPESPGASGHAPAPRDRSYGAYTRGRDWAAQRLPRDRGEQQPPATAGWARPGDRWARSGDAGSRASTHRDDWRRDRRDDDRREWRDDGRHYRDGYRDGRRDDHRYGHSHRRWDHRGWRSDHRYDWYRYRAANRALFSLGRYYAPFRGYSYSRINIGIRLGSPFYANRYWIHDPWRYRLPAVYGPYRWVRYYDDALLVDIYSGEVVDVIYNFFW